MITIYLIMSIDFAAKAHPTKLYTFDLSYLCCVNLSVVSYRLFELLTIKKCKFIVF